MKKILLLALMLLTPFSAYAVPTTWDFSGGNLLQPLQNAWGAQIKGSYFTGTSTSATSTFPNLQATNRFLGAGLTDCDAATNALTWNDATWNFGCNTISGGGSGTVGSGTTGQFPYYAANGTTLTATSSLYLMTSGAVGVGTTTASPGFNPGIVTGLNKNLIFSTNRDTDNFRGNIQFFNLTNESKSGLEWYDDAGDSIAWLVAHDTNPLGVPGDHHHIEIETADLAGQKQGRFTIGYDCDYDCLATFNQTELQINRNSGQTNGNVLFNGGGQIRNTATQRIVPNNAINTLAFDIGTSTADNDIQLSVQGGTELEIAETTNITGSLYVSASGGFGTTSPTHRLTVEATGSSGTTAGPQMAFRQNQTTINDTTNSNLGEIFFSGADIAAGEGGLGAKIRAQASNPWNGTTNDYPTDLLFFTQVDGGATGMLERLRIRNNGLVGIGTTTPFARLSVHANNGDTTQNLFAVGSSTASATTTLFNISNTGKVTATDSTNNWTGVANPTRFPVLSTGTTTTWTASTTGTGYSPRLTLPFAGTLRNVVCSLDASFLGVNIQIDGVSIAPSYFVASSTAGTITFTGSNTFTKGQVLSMDVGTTTSATTKNASCTFAATETP